MKPIENVVEEWINLQNFTDSQKEMNTILLSNRLKMATDEIEIVDYLVNEKQIILIKNDKTPITFNLNIQPTINY